MKTSGVRSEVSRGSECTFIMVDDDVDEIFFTRREIRKQGFVNRFVAEEDPDKLFSTMDDLCELGVSPDAFLLFLDLNMPKCSGIDLLKSVRAHKLYADTPAIIFSGEASDVQKEEAIRAGASGFMIKPFSSDELFTVINSLSDIKKALIRL